MLRRLLICCALGILATVFVLPVSAKNCTLQQLASLHLDHTISGWPLVPMVIGDQPVRMWLNTSSALSTLDPSAAERLGLKARPFPSRMPAVHMGNRRIDTYVTVPMMSLGNARLKNLEIAILRTEPTPSDQRSRADAPVGLLGMDVLSNLDVEFDLGHDTINLFSSDHCPDSAVYWTDRYDVVPLRRGALKDLYFVMELDGKKLQAKLATASERSILEASAARRLYGWDKSSPEVRVMSLTASGLTVLNAQVFRTPQEAECPKQAQIITDRDGAAGFFGCMGAYPLELGRSVLNKLRLYLAAKEEKLYFTAADAPPKATPTAAQ